VPKPSITYADDFVLLEFAPPGMAGAATTVLPGGGTLAVDPLEPARLLRVTLESTDLDDLAGVLSVRLGAPPGARTQTLVGWEPERRLATLQRLAFANWYARYTPLDVKSTLVDLDVAREAWSAGLKVSALERFSETADHLLEPINSEVATGGALAQEVVDRLRQTAQARVAALGGDDPRSVQIHEPPRVLECRHHRDYSNCSPPSSQVPQRTHRRWRLPRPPRWTGIWSSLEFWKPTKE
jgi:hypothetical protein